MSGCGVITAAVCALFLTAAACANAEEEGHRGALMEQLKEARVAHQADPADAAARYHYAELSYEAGHFGDALDLLESLLAADDPDVEVLLLGARIEYLFGRYDRAEKLLHRVLEREPDNTPAAAKLVFIYYQTNRYSLCEALPGEALEGMRLPHMDLMLAFEDVPYQAVWRDGDETVVPFLVTDPLPVIEVEVNGRKVTVLIDTGGDAFILDPSIASELGIEIVASMMGMFAGGMEAEVGFARAKSLALGGVTLHSVPISVLPTGGMAIGGHTLEGIVGTGVLKQFLATLDYPNEELVLRAPSGRAASAFRAGAAGKVLDEVPFYLQSTHFLLARGSLNGVDDLLF
ncbi:MAG: aspartyl protease family protein, partial [Candidatus Eisenbacteria sp.]|nr:aspartyl protease family protein [Candidatus Eisenbacteria bacterium]